MRVIIVDDERELVLTLSERLGFRGIEADWAVNGADAVKLVTENRYDLAVLDVKMPGISGLELKKQLQAITPDMKFIFVTGHGSQADFQSGTQEAGADNYLIKPVNID
ncbi:MAG: response regulator, partial [bacterium]|nr:response regulator [bacterium]